MVSSTYPSVAGTDDQDIGFFGKGFGGAKFIERMGLYAPEWNRWVCNGERAKWGPFRHDGRGG